MCRVTAPPVTGVMEGPIVMSNTDVSSLYTHCNQTTLSHQHLLVLSETIETCGLLCDAED